MSEHASGNKDREIYRRPSPEECDPGGFYQPSLSITETGALMINVGGYCHIRTIEDWHGTQNQIATLTAERDAARKQCGEYKSALADIVNEKSHLKARCEELEKRESELLLLRRDQQMEYDRKFEQAEERGARSMAEIAVNFVCCINSVISTKALMEKWRKQQQKEKP